MKNSASKNELQRKDDLQKIPYEKPLLQKVSLFADKVLGACYESLTGSSCSLGTTNQP
jgi:hypothetical protein